MLDIVSNFFFKLVTFLKIYHIEGYLILNKVAWAAFLSLHSNKSYGIFCFIYDCKKTSIFFHFENNKKLSTWEKIVTLYLFFSGIIKVPNVNGFENSEVKINSEIGSLECTLFTCCSSGCMCYLCMCNWRTDPLKMFMYCLCWHSA